MTYEEAIQIPISLVREKLGHQPDHLPDCKDAVEYVQAHLKSTKQDDTRADAVRWLGIMFTAYDWHQPLDRKVIKDDHPQWHISRWQELDDLALIRYLEKNGIDADLVKELLTEIYLTSKTGYGSMNVFGLRNEKGGFALEGPYISTLLGKRDISILRRGNGIAPTIHVFLNFMDMLAAFSTLPELRHEADIICLNSPELLSEAFANIKSVGYSHVYSWFPNNPLGNELQTKLTAYTKTEKGLKHKIFNNVYRGYDNVAAWRKAKFKKTK